MKLIARPTPSTLLARLIDSPDLVRTVRALPAPAFSALVREIGVEDAGELVALATTEQLVAAFDEDLFAGGPGERERFDGARFVVWLEVLLEAGDAVAARRVAELSEDFVIHALSTLLLVLDHEQLRARMRDGGRDARAADKAIDSALTEEIDGYLLVSRRVDGWDAALALILALDRDHRALLVRLLDRLAYIGVAYVDDLDALAGVLSEEDSLAEDVEAEREARRGRQGFVEPRAARSFLALARTAPQNAERDPITRAYFRELERRPVPESSSRIRGLLGAPASHSLSVVTEPWVEALRMLGEAEPRLFGERMAELAYLANVLMVGEQNLAVSEATERALAIVGDGAEREASHRRGQPQRATAAELYDVLRTRGADWLFRLAWSAKLPP